MLLLSSTSNGVDSVVQLITVLLIFVFVLVLAFFTTKLTAEIQKGRMSNSNVKILETFKIAPTKYIQIVKIGEKYFSYIVCKDTVTLLGELAENDVLECKNKCDPTGTKMSFRDIFEKLKNNT